MKYFLFGMSEMVFKKKSYQLRVGNIKNFLKKFENDNFRNAADPYNIF